MRALRRSCRISRRQSKRNERIKETIKLEDKVYDDIQKKQLIWFELVMRMIEKRLPKIVLNCKATKKRKRGNPRRTWMEGINKAMEKWGLD